MNKLRLFAIAFFIGTAFTSTSQIVVDSLAIEEYVQDVLLGSGIQATNIQFTGCLNQIGYMHEGGTVGLGIDGGVVLSTDQVRNIEVPSPNLWLGGSGCTGVNGDPDLLSIANSVPPLIGQAFSVGSVNDVAILEFDFVPTGDTLSFNYIFGSDEYLEWVNSSFNDIFAFFLSGPGITGPYDAPAGFPGGAINIAQVPDSDPVIPITISSVNNNLNAAYYIGNSNNQDISIDGYTVTLTAWAEVVCGETYHIKLAIADGSDTALESIVILEEGSFSSNAVVDVNLSINVGGPDADTIYEDCGEAVLTFTRAEVSDLAIEDMVVVDWVGTATMGVDYNAMPDTIIFPVGVSSITLNLDAFEDGLLEGSELVHLDILNLAACNGSGLVSEFEFYINDEPEPLVVEGYDIQICQGASTVLEPVITGGYGNFIFGWSTGEDTETIEVSPLNNTQYILTVSDTCGMPSDDGIFNVDILVLPPLTINIDQNDLLLNCNESANVTATAAGGDGNYTYYWYDENDMNLWGWNNSLWYSTWNGEGEINVEVTDGCGFTATDVINVELNAPDLIVDVPVTLNAACNTPFTITAATSAGTPWYSYSWQTNGFFEWDEWDDTYDNPGVNEETIVTVNVSDACGQQFMQDIIVTIEQTPITIDLIDDVTGDCTTVFNFAPTVTGGSGAITYQWTENGGVLGSASTLYYNNNISATVTLTVSDMCGSETIDQVQVEIINSEVFVEIGDDIFASCIDNNTITANVSGGSGAIDYNWLVNGSSEGQDDAFEIQTYETVDVTVEIEDLCGMTATDMLTIFIPNIPLNITLSQDTAVCLNGTAALSAVAEGGEGGFVYFWPQLGNNTQDTYVEALQNSGAFTVIATDICGETVEGQIYVEVLPLEAGILGVEMSPNFYEFTANPSPECDDCVYAWDMGDGSTFEEANFQYTFDGLGSYTVSLLTTNSIGCTDIAYLTVNAPPSIYIPNAFSPNGDGINDAWQIVANSVKEYEIHIFNRWGEEVFTSTDPSQAWVGDHSSNMSHYVADGVYTYIVKVKGFNSEAFERKGNIVMTR